MSDDDIIGKQGGRLHLDTRRDRVRCTCAEGHLFTATLLTAIDIDTDPGALDELTDEGLQQVSCPECRGELPLAEPLVLHAREGGRLALFVPEPLAHRELHLRAELMREVADADPDETPAYAAEFQTLVGSRALRYWLFGPSARALSSDPPERSSSESPSESPEPEPPPAPTPEQSPPRRTSEQRQSKPAIHEAFADLMGPEVRTSSIPPEVEEEEEADEAQLLDEDWLDDDSLGSGRVARPSRGSESRPPGERHAEPPPATRDEEPRKTKPSKPPHKTVDFAGLLTEDEDSGEFMLVEDDLDDDEERFGLEDEEEVFGGALRESSYVGTTSPEVSDSAADAGAGPSAGSARGFEVIGDRVILRHRVEPDQAGSYDPSRAELWIQLHVIDRFPLALLAVLADPRDPETERLWWPLDLRAEPHREVVHALRRSFRAEVRLIDPSDDTVGSFEVRGERELNAAVVLKRATQSFAGLPAGREPFDAAVEAVGRLPNPLGVEPPPPLHPRRLPRPADEEDLARQLAILAEWTTGQRRDELVLVRSFPLDHLEAIVAELVDAALDQGVALPEALADRAESSGGRQGPDNDA